MTDKYREPTTIVIFGASGELTKRKIVPALYNLFLEDLLPDRFLVIERLGARSRRRLREANEASRG